MKLLLLLISALPIFAQNCPYTFSPVATQAISIGADASAAPNTITVTVPTGCNWLYSTDASWITFPGATQLFGSGTGAINWVAAVNLTTGLRTGKITVSTLNGPVVFTIVQAAPVCTLALDPTSASVPVSGGSGTMKVQTNCTWALTGASNYISLSAIGGTLNGSVTYGVPANLCVDSRVGFISAQAGGRSGPAQTLQISQPGSASNLTVTPPTFSAPPSAFDGQLTITTDNSCGWGAYSDVSWLNITGKSSGNGTSSLTFHGIANTSDARSGGIHIGSQIFTVTQQAVAAPAVTLAGVVNGANYSQGAVSPGEIVAVFGSNIGPVSGVVYQVSAGFLPKTLGGVQLSFNGVAAPLLYASAGQVNAIVPYGVTGTTKVQLSYQNGQSNVLTLPVQASTPGILTLDRSGFGGGAILNQDLSVNTPSNPAAAGSVVVIYCVGGGVTVPATSDGSVVAVPAPVLAEQSVTVKIDGVNAEVKYSGAVSFSIAGLTQINAIVPPALKTHGNLPISLTIGGATSAAGATVAIQ